MKRILLGLVCSSTAFGQYMTKEEVIKDYLATKNSKLEKASVLTPEQLERQKNLIPMNEFLPDYKLEKKKPTFELQGVAPDSVDLRNRNTPIKSQDNGKCTAFAGTAAIENLMQRSGLIPGLDLSEWGAWEHYKQYSCAAFINAITKNYLCDEKNFPQYGQKSVECTNKSYVKIATQKFIDDSVPAMKDALARGSVVYLGMSTPNGMLSCDKVISLNTTAANGGHALLISGYYTSGTETLAIIRNSWGTNCGDKGYQYMPMSLCSKSGFYCQMWEISSVEIKKPLNTPTPSPTIKPEPSCKKWQTVWYAPWKKRCVQY